MPEFAPQKQPISRLEKRICSVDCSGNLDGIATIVGAPSVDEVGTSHLALTDVQVNTTAVTINGRIVPPGKAVLFACDARGPNVKPGWTYKIHIEFDSDTGERIAGGVKVKTD